MNTPQQTFVAATRNEHKFLELQTAAAGHLILVPCPTECPPVDETSDTYKGNARVKALQVARFTGLPTMGDDTGLEVDALGGAPGVRSARYAGPDQDSSSNCQKLLREIATVPFHERTARYRTILVARLADGSEVVSQAICEGLIVTEPHGPMHFGYQSIFSPSEGDGRTLAEMQLKEKIYISHHGRAMRLMLERLRRQ